jgi:hypothetical protein
VWWEILVGGTGKPGRRYDPSAVLRSAATGAISTVKCRPCVIQKAKEREGNGGGGFSEDVTASRLSRGEEVDGLYRIDQGERER